MSHALAPRTPLMPRQIQFVPGQRQPATDLPLATLVRFVPMGPIVADDTSPTAEELDEIVRRLAEQYGATVDQIRGMTFDVMLPSLGIPEDVRGTPAPFTVTVRRDRHGGHIARASVTLAYGYGETIGEAFREYMDDFLYRQTLLYTERDQLGPGMQEELRELERLHAGAG